MLVVEPLDIRSLSVCSMMFIFTVYPALLLLSSSIVHSHSIGPPFSIFGSEINFHFPHEHPEETPGEFKLQKRQACGAGVGSCPEGQCCSAAGQCGTGATFCIGPDCQLAYGPGCDGNIVPPGASTLNIPRPRIGNIPYGTAITTCTQPNTLALTFDDGPYLYTNSVLSTLAKYNTKATFMITGNNLAKGRIDDPSLPWAQIIRDTHAAGHQLASHSWSHQDLTLITDPNMLQNQVVYNEIALRNILGFIPTYFRPPYGFLTPSVASYLGGLGYHLIIWDIDTKDYMNDDPSLIEISKNYFSGNLSAPNGVSGHIELSHDVHAQTAAQLVEYMLQTLASKGYKAVTVGECLGDDPQNWYRDAGGVPSSSTNTSRVPSQTVVAQNNVGGGSSTSGTSTTPISSSSSTSISAFASSITSGPSLSTSTTPNHTAIAATVSDSTLVISTISSISVVSHTSTTSSTNPAATNTSKSDGNEFRPSAWMSGLFLVAGVAISI